MVASACACLNLHRYSLMSRFEDNPFLHSLGASIESWGDGRVVLHLPVQPNHLNRQGALQGGVVSALLDAACGYAGIEQDNPERSNSVTISLAINFIGSVKSGHVLAIGTVTGRGRKIYFSQAEVRTPDGRVIATAQGSFKHGRPRVEANAPAVSAGTST
ncbi:hotdog fold thioesterase [Bordetella sp. 15P40C-2]|nr:hotdog fold thioesterase [Bordetella sp. 15P40C-2]MVW79435.1 hotdog fold thioesterase [Bordetella sp. 02P26C-1]